MSGPASHIWRLCLDQANGMIEAAHRLNETQSWPHIVYHLGLLALEEVGKASMVAAKSVPNAHSDGDWFDRWFDSHRRKLQWAVWSPLTRLDPADFEQARQFAERAHRMRLDSLYVDTNADLADPPPHENVLQDDADQILVLARSRLEHELQSRDTAVEVDELTTWFLDTMADQDRSRTLLSPSFLRQFEILGSKPRDWVVWARAEMARLDAEAEEFLKAELARPAAASGAAKPKWRANAPVYTPSHSLRPKILARWNDRIEPVQFLWTGKKDALTLQISLNDNRPLQDLAGRLISLSKLAVACISIGSLGYFWFQRPGFQQKMFKEVRDLEHNRPMDLVTPETFWDDGRAVALTDAHIDNALHCMMAYAPLAEAEAEPIFAPYFNGLAMIAKSDTFYRFDDLARHEFVRSLAGALRHYGGWNGAPDEFEACFHHGFAPFMPEPQHREKVFQSLKTRGDPNDTPLVNLRTAKHMADLYLVHTASRTWKNILDKRGLIRG
ncbi:AbiV family abortive infection protein [Bradyrhizobium sp. USDA 329]|uniref:AbiV family abortive infection protein n=1 Tax=unclassified Bradyrhizobium TaxID=2631580 RepID=UPI0035196B84